MSQAISQDEPYDAVGIGFGPSNLAFAIALQESLEAGEIPESAEKGRKPRVLFLEKQKQFTWHEGMLLPSSHMQISFVKDLASLRNPRSRFTFLNYLHQHNRLVEFVNLDTFLPDRIEYVSYMTWCAREFSDIVLYGHEVKSITPVVKSTIGHGRSQVDSFIVTSYNHFTCATESIQAKRVVVAMGGKPIIPKSLPQNNPRIFHTSQFTQSLERVLPDRSAPCRIAVLGAGQSAAECFNDLHSRYPNAKTFLCIRGEALKPLDDSPFVNGIFHPDRVDDFYDWPELEREHSLLSHSATNYSVVRPTLLDQLYKTLYTQRVRCSDAAQWQHHIIPHVNLESAEDIAGDNGGIRLTLRSTLPSRAPEAKALEVDAAVIATGYQRDFHETLLAECRPWMKEQPQKPGKCEVARDYRVLWAEGNIAADAGIWLLGSNEKTHGMSDSLLSILSVRGGDLVRSLFGTTKSVKIASPSPRVVLSSRL